MSAPMSASGVWGKAEIAFRDTHIAECPGADVTRSVDSESRFQPCQVSALSKCLSCLSGRYRRGPIEALGRGVEQVIVTFAWFR